MNEALKEQVIDMSEGNPGCINVLMQTYKLVETTGLVVSRTAFRPRALLVAESGASSRTTTARTSKPL